MKNTAFSEVYKTNPIFSFLLVFILDNMKAKEKSYSINISTYVKMTRAVLGFPVRSQISPPE